MRIRVSWQIMIFCLGVAFAAPAKSYADDFDDVLDDLLAYRLQTRAGIVHENTAVSPVLEKEAGKVNRTDHLLKKNGDTMPRAKAGTRIKQPSPTALKSSAK
jgi:hypothetical protein